MWRVTAIKNGKVIGSWDMHDKDRAKDLKKEKEKQGYKVEIKEV